MTGGGVPPRVGLLAGKSSPRYHFIIPTAIAFLLIAFHANAVDIERVEYKEEPAKARPAAEEQAAPPATAAKGHLTYEEEKQLEEMEEELYRMHEETWDDRYRSRLR
jgi:hypothetical protein